MPRFLQADVSGCIKQLYLMFHTPWSYVQVHYSGLHGLVLQAMMANSAQLKIIT